MIQFNKEVLIDVLKAYGETSFLERAENISEIELTQIGNLAGNYIGKYNLVHRTIIAGVIEFYEGKEREPKFKRRNLKAYNR